MAENLVSAMQPKLRDRYLDLKHKNMDFQVALEKMNQELDGLFSFFTEFLNSMYVYTCLTFLCLAFFQIIGLNSRKAVLEDEVALSALKREALTLYDNLRDLEQRRDELEEEEKHRGTPAQERERLLEQVGTSLFDNAPNYLVPSLGRYPKGILLIFFCHVLEYEKLK